MWPATDSHRYPHQPPGSLILTQVTHIPSWPLLIRLSLEIKVTLLPPCSNLQSVNDTIRFFSSSEKLYQICSVRYLYTLVFQYLGA